MTSRARFVAATFILTGSIADRVRAQAPDSSQQVSPRPRDVAAICDVISFWEAEQPDNVIPDKYQYP